MNYLLTTLPELWSAIEDEQIFSPIRTHFSVFIKANSTGKDFRIRANIVFDYYNISRSLYDTLCDITKDDNILVQIENGNARISSLKYEVKYDIGFDMIKSALRMEKLNNLGI